MADEKKRNSTQIEYSIYEDYSDRRKLTSPEFKVGTSTLGGRGLFAQCDLPSECLIFREPALVLGPRDDPRCQIVCVGCHKALNQLRLCSRGCGLPVCDSNCEQSNLHSECEFLTKLPTADVRLRLAMVAPLRSLKLSPTDRALLRWLEGHERQQHESIIQQLEPFLEGGDLDLVRKCCQVLDATAYETPCPGGSIRGLYPTAALMNHDCVPNTRHCFDNQGRMVVETTRPVERGEELLVSYTCTTWGTCARQAHLQSSKNFSCHCRRCSDPHESGSRLMALYCPKQPCTGVLLPITNSKAWGCTACTAKLQGHKVSVIHRAVGGALAKLAAGNPREACRVLMKNSMVPGSNQMAVEFKLSLIRLYGNDKGFTWTDLRDEDLLLKQLICTEILLLLELLGLAHCRQRGFLLLELIATFRELDRRKCAIFDRMKLKELTGHKTAEDMYNEAATILRYDAKAADRLNAAKEFLI